MRTARTIRLCILIEGYSCESKSQTYAGADKANPDFIITGISKSLLIPMKINTLAERRVGQVFCPIFLILSVRNGVTPGAAALLQRNISAEPLMDILIFKISHCQEK